MEKEKGNEIMTESLYWFISRDVYDKYRTHQHEYEDGDCDGNYIGALRIGNLCFDILNWGNHLWFDLYVGGVDTGYGYSEKDGYERFPYDYADSCSFRWDKDVSGTELKSFQDELSDYIKKFIMEKKSYTTDTKAIFVDLIAKANEDLQLW